MQCRLKGENLKKFYASHQSGVRGLFQIKRVWNVSNECDKICREIQKKRKEKNGQSITQVSGID